jgi:gluconolactonase
MSKPVIALEQLETFADGIDHPEGICRAPDGYIYVGGQSGQIYRLEPDDSFVELVTSGGSILGLAADADNRIYAIDHAKKCVWRFDPAWRQLELWVKGPNDCPFRMPNWGSFDSVGNYYLSDSGRFGHMDGCLWRVTAGTREPKVWTESTRNFPNGLTLAPDDSKLYALESFPGALVEVPILPDGSAGDPVLLCDLDPRVPDGIALAEDGGIYISCYRPDSIYRWHPHDGLSLIANDPRGSKLAAPTNIVFCGPRRDQIVAPNVGGRHLTRFSVGISGVPLNFPTRSQLGS